MRVDLRDVGVDASRHAADRRAIPDRVRSLVLWSPFARFLYAADQPFGMTEAGLEKYIDGFERFVGTGALVEVLAPSWAGDAAKRRWWGA